MTTKIHIKMGPIEIEYEGDEAFLKQDLLNLLTSVTKLHQKSGVSGAEEIEPGGVIPPESEGVTEPLKATVGTIADRLACKSGPDLVLAACAHLSLVQKLANFKRRQILDEMKKASGYYKTSHGDNLTSYIRTLRGNDKLIEQSKNVFALNKKTKDELKRQLETKLA